MTREQKVTLGEMRSGNGLRWLIFYCCEFKCSHSVVIDAAQWSDDIRLSDLEAQVQCQVRGHHGADIRALFESTPLFEAV